MLLLLSRTFWLFLLQGLWVSAALLVAYCPASRLRWLTAYLSAAPAAVPCQLLEHGAYFGAWGGAAQGLAWYLLQLGQQVRVCLISWLSMGLPSLEEGFRNAR